MRQPADVHWVHEVRPLPPLTFVYYTDAECGVVGAHCLELDIGGQGSSKEAATKDLQEAIETYILSLVEDGLGVKARPAPDELHRLPDRATFYPMLLRLSKRVSRSGKAKKSKKELVFSPPAPKQSELMLA